MAKTYEQAYNDITASQEGKYKLNIVQTVLLADTLHTFEQLFTIIPKSTIQTLLGTSFYAFPKKVMNPGTFTIDEIDFLASLFNVEFDIIIRFIRRAQQATSNQEL